MWLRRLAWGAFGWLVLAQAAFAGEHWICLRTPNFEIFTTADESSGRAALVFFEEVRRAFTESLGLKLPENRRVTIIAFKDEQAFAPYRPTPLIAAYTMTLSNHEFMVLQDLVPERYSLALHEYTHVVVAQAGLNLPLWLNEGFAEVYATLKPVGRKLVVGRVINDRLAAAQAGLIDLREVLNADRRSPLYHEANRVGIFYAESWALLHMLKFDARYSPRFDRVLDAIGRGETGEKALQTVYGKSIEQIQADLAAYVHGDHFREGVIHARLEKGGPEPKQVPVDPLEMSVMLAAIEARGPRRAEALRTLDELVTANPGKPAPAEALAWLQLAGPDAPGAIAAFRRAVQAGTRDPNLCFQFALKMRPVISDADYVAALRRAAEIDPDFSAAQQQLAAHAFNAHDYREAVTRLHLVKKLGRSQAFVYYRALAYAAFQIGDVAQAKSAASRAQEFAVAADDMRLAEEMRKYVNGENAAASPPSLQPILQP